MPDTLLKNIVASGLATKCEIGIAYAIGIERTSKVYQLIHSILKQLN